MGADAAILPRCRDPQGPDETHMREQVDVHVDMFSKQGLRTLVQAMRVIAREDVHDTLQRLHDANAAVDDRKAALDDVYNTLECNLSLLGVTAVEDKLQPGVKVAMDSFREAGIVLWVLTGDKVETAINISLSSGHFTHQTKQLLAVGLMDSESCLNVLQTHRSHCVRTKGGRTNLSGVRRHLSGAGRHFQSPNVYCMPQA